MLLIEYDVIPEVNKDVLQLVTPRWAGHEQTGYNVCVCVATFYRQGNTPHEVNATSSVGVRCCLFRWLPILGRILIEYNSLPIYRYMTMIRKLVYRFIS